MKNDFEWFFRQYGTSTTTDPAKNGYTGSGNEDSVRVYSLNGSGKLVPRTMDGVSFYYTRVPVDKNFKFKARAHVNDWSFTNGQEGFGIMACDRVGELARPYTWNNSFMAVVTKTFYGWDKEKQDYTLDEAADQIAMFQGVSAIAKHGVNAENLIEFEKDGGAAVAKYFTSTQISLEHSCAQFGAGFYNIVANYTPPHTFDESRMGQKDYGVGTLISQAHDSTPPEYLKEDFIFCVEKNNSGFLVSYLDEDGSVIGQKQFFDSRYYDEKGEIRPEPLGSGYLAQIDREWIHLGFFCARNADVTFSDIELDIREPAQDPPTMPHERLYFENRSKFASALYSGTEEYAIAYQPSWQGQLVIKNDAGEVIFDGTAFADKYLYVRTKLKKGVNSFSAEFTPDEDFHYGLDEQHPDNVYNVLSSYETLHQSFSVTYRSFEGDKIYASPEGRAENEGSRESPVDIATAIRHAAPGQTILLMGKEYLLEEPLKIERGMDGTEEAPIKLLPDPEGEARVTLDFGSGKNGVRDWSGSFAGFCIEGKYWIIEHIDVTRTIDIQVGIRVSGSHNILNDVTAHHCGNVGICIIGRSYDDRRHDTDADGDLLWPHHNRLVGCIAYENTDKGHDLADGFGCKILAGEGNVFERCISHHNSDDGFDFFTKSEFGGMGQIQLINCIAYMNGYLHENGKLITGGNGNGFKLGGEGISGKHRLVGCIAFDNKGEGFDSNSCPDVRLYDCKAYDNEKSNIHLYTKKGNDTDFYMENVSSIKAGGGIPDILELGPNQSLEDVLGPEVRLYEG